MQDRPSHHIRGKGLIKPWEEAAAATMRVLKELAYAKLVVPTDEEKKQIDSFDLPPHLRRDRFIPYELMPRASAERISSRITAAITAAVCSACA